MYYRLALKNLKSRKTRTVLTGLGIAIGIASLVLLLALSEGLKQAAFRSVGSESPLTQLTVQAKTEKNSIMKLLPLGNTGSENKITRQTLETIGKVSHVEKVYPEMIFGNISSLRISWLGEGLQTDTMIFGVPYEFIAQDYNGDKEAWDNASAPYPALISKKIIDIYNVTIAPTSGLPGFTQKDLSGIDVVLLPNESTFFPQLGKAQRTVPARLVGFSDKTSIVGITLPLRVVKQLNLEHESDYEENYLRLHLQIDKAENVEKVRTQINEMGFDAVSPLEEIKSISENFLIVELGLGSISLIILFVAGLMIANTFLSAVSERKHEIGIFRALGATRADIRKIFLAEAAVIGALGGAGGIIAGVGGGLIFNGFILQSLPELSFKPDTLFIYNPLSLLMALLFAIILSLIFAFIPAARAARLNPLEALTQ